MVKRHLLTSYKVKYATKSAPRYDNSNVTLMALGELNSRTLKWDIRCLYPLDRE